MLHTYKIEDTNPIQSPILIERKKKIIMTKLSFPALWGKSNHSLKKYSCWEAIILRSISTVTLMGTLLKAILFRTYSNKKSGGMDFTANCKLVTSNPMNPRTNGAYFPVCLHPVIDYRLWFPTVGYFLRPCWFSTYNLVREDIVSVATIGTFIGSLSSDDHLYSKTFWNFYLMPLSLWEICLNSAPKLKSFTWMNNRYFVSWASKNVDPSSLSSGTAYTLPNTLLP